jgi:hypothetical protein
LFKRTDTHTDTGIVFNFTNVVFLGVSYTVWPVAVRWYTQKTPWEKGLTIHYPCQLQCMQYEWMNFVRIRENTTITHLLPPPPPPVKFARFQPCFLGLGW